MQPLNHRTFGLTSAFLKREPAFYELGHYRLWNLAERHDRVNPILESVSLSFWKQGYYFCTIGAKYSIKPWSGSLAFAQFIRNFDS